MFNSKLLSGNTNPYASSAVVVDSTAPVQYYLQQQAHQAAKEEATDKYLQGMLEVDDKGMRNQERPDLINMRTKLQDTYIKNRDAIVHPEKDNGRALLEYRGAVQGIKSFVNKSTAEKEEDKRIATLSDWAKKEGLKMPDDVMNVIQKRSYSINDPRFHKDPNSMTGGYTSSDIEPFYKPFGTAEQKQWIDATMSGMKPDEVEHPNKKPMVKDGLLYTYKLNQFGKDKLAQIGNSANTLYDNVPAAKRYFESEFKDPNEVIKYNQIFKSQYGRDIQSPRDVSIAWTLSKVPKPTESFDAKNKPETMAEKIALHRAYKNIDADFARMSNEQQGKWIDKKIDENTPKAEPSTNALYPFNTKLTSPIEDPLILGALAKGDEMPNLQFNHQTGKYLMQIPLISKADGKPLYVKKAAGKADEEVTNDVLTDKELENGVELVPVYKKEVTLDRTQLKDLMAENIKNQKFIMNERGMGKNKTTLSMGSYKSNRDGASNKDEIVLPNTPRARQEASKQPIKKSIKGW